MDFLVTPNVSTDLSRWGDPALMAKNLHSPRRENCALRKPRSEIRRESAAEGTSRRHGLAAGYLAAVLVLLAFIYLSASVAYSADKAVPSAASDIHSSTPMIVVGFLGGFVHRDDVRHAEVQLARKLQAAHPNNLRIATFQNWHRKAAHRAILRWLDIDQDGKLSDAEKHGARIVLFGHSWGGAAVVSLAHQLQQESIPVLLTIQVDSIAKPGQNDRVVPENVIRAVNFFQTRGLLHGRTKITAADPSRTEILGDFLFEYKQTPAECSLYPWLTRHLFPGHTAIECDPHVWSQVEELINKYSFAQPAGSEVALR